MNVLKEIVTGVCLGTTFGVIFAFPFLIGYALYLLWIS